MLADQPSIGPIILMMLPVAAAADIIAAEMAVSTRLTRCLLPKVLPKDASHVAEIKRRRVARQTRVKMWHLRGEFPEEVHGLTRSQLPAASPVAFGTTQWTLLQRSVAPLYKH